MLLPDGKGPWLGLPMPASGGKPATGTRIGLRRRPMDYLGIISRLAPKTLSQLKIETIVHSVITSYLLDC